ncbi:MAG: DUF4132 domain-containing protein [Clostridia bacterium]|nr:DUF4132 domain-containing protein [Clostridia bacterium]
MDLLNNKSADKNSRMKAEILDILGGMNILPDNMKIAEQFFDFDKELDIELLKKLKFQDMSSLKYYTKSQTFIRKIKESCEYSDGYILFLDQLGHNTVYNLLSYSFDNDYFWSSNLKKIVDHALARRYTSDEIISVIAALIAERSGAEYYSNRLYNLAKENPLALLKSGRYYCHGQYANASLKLYSFALAFIEPINKATDDNKELKECIDYACTRIYDVSKGSKSDWKYKNIAKFLGSVCFMSYHHSKKTEEILKDIVVTNKKHFINGVLDFVPTAYFEKNTDKFFELLNLDKNPSFLTECLYHVVNFGNYYPLLTNNKKIFLAYIAKKYPETYTEIMRARTIMIDGKSCDNDAVYSYDYLYDILKANNPDAVTKYNVDIDADILKMIIEDEQCWTDCKTEIEEYLSGKCDSSVLEQVSDKLSCDSANINSYGVNNSWQRVNNHRHHLDCLVFNNCDFRKRLVILKMYQNDFATIRNWFYRTDKKLSFTEIANILISEKMPVSVRFSSYENFTTNSYFTDQQKTEEEEQLSRVMAEHSAEFDSDYEQVCKNGKLLARKLYVRYLGLSDKDDSNKDRLLSMFADSSKEVRELVAKAASQHKNYESEVLSMLESKKSAIRETAVDVLSIWGANNYKDILLGVAENEKSAKLKEKINRVLNITTTVETQGDEAFSPMLFVDSIHKGGKAKKLQWLYETPNGTVHFKNGNVAEDKYIQAILLCYADMSNPGVNENAALLAQELNEQELNKYAETIFSKWTAQGAEAKKKWVLYFCAIHGGYNMIAVLLNYIKEWAENARGAIASEAVRAIACNGSSEALMSVDNIAHKFKHKQVKSAAVKALDDAAEELGITSDELGDRIVPDLSFDENMERVFDYGTRKFKVYLTPTLELEVFDESNKKLKTLPSPAKKDDETIAKQSNADFKAMKKQLKNVVSIQKLRLETALLADRRWTVENWNNLFVKNPVMHSFAIGLIWAAYENDTLVQTFRYMEDGTFNTADEDEFELPENCTIGLVHPIDLSEDELSTWKEQLSDYEITQPIEQLERKVYRIKDDEIGQLDFNRFKGREINGMTLLGRMTKMGWYKGSVQDAGCFYTFYREDITKRFKDKDNNVHLVGNAVELNFSGMYVGGEDETVTIENIRFYKPGTVKRGSYEYDEPDEQRTIAPDKISPRYLSEIINQIETILK